MNETLLTQPAYQTETLSEIYLRNRPSTADLWPEVFGNLKQSSLVSVSGANGSGKSIFMMEVIAKALMKDNLEVLLLDVDKHFNMFKLIEILLKYMDEDQVQCRLGRLKILTCYETNFHAIITKLPQILEGENSEKVSLVLIDSLGLFYYTQAKMESSGKNLSKNAFITSYLQHLKNLGPKFNVTVMYTTPGFMSGNSNIADLTTHNVELMKLQSGSFSMTITSKNHDKIHNFKIDNQGIKFSSSQV
jgi:predicted ATP-dependent serine protease